MSKDQNQERVSLASAVVQANTFLRRYNLPILDIERPGLTPYPAFAMSGTSWGISYMLLFGTSTIKSRRVGPIGLTCAVLATTSTYAKEFMTDWLE
ncbi:hypothetical protein HDU97_006364 [Phlyctochytrium planicorne]|nr:hypothetical protein HDU97_006364 [Phlyctochytrium planicorne]